MKTNLLVLEDVAAKLHHQVCRGHEFCGGDQTGQHLIAHVNIDAIKLNLDKGISRVLADGATGKFIEGSCGGLDSGAGPQCLGELLKNDPVFVTIQALSLGRHNHRLNGGAGKAREHRL